MSIIHRSLFLSGAALILFASSAAQADGSLKNFGESRFEIITIEPSAGEAVPPAPSVQPLADGTKAPGEAAKAAPEAGVSEPAVVSSALPAADISAAPSGSCAGGLAEPSNRALNVFHTPAAITVVGADKEVHVNNLDGILAYDGGTYSLRLVTLEAREFVPFSGVSFPMRIRFDYADANETHVSVDVPVRLGAPSLGVEKIIAAKGTVPLSGNDLMPFSRAYATMTDCNLVGLPIKRVVMTTPLEMSEDQFARFSQI